MKTLINVRGACASGKTTAVKGFCRRHKQAVETLYVKSYKCPVTVLDGGRIVAVGDYLAEGCTECDKYSGKQHIKAAIYAAAVKYNPEVIIFEGMLVSLLYNATAEISDFGKKLGYEYVGIWLQRGVDSRNEMLFKRNNGVPRGIKHLQSDGKRASRSARRLAANGYRIIPVNVEKLTEADMGFIIDKAIRAGG